MAININKYVDVTSGVGAATIVPERQLIARLFTDNILLSPHSFMEFANPAAVGAFFGTNSNEYLRALFYFSFISKNITTPELISFVRWVDTAVAPMIFGATGNYVFTTFSSITTGSLGLTINGVVLALTGIDFTGNASLSAVAGTLQTAIRTGTGTMYTSATVTYDAVNSRFVFTGGSAIAATISVQTGASGVDLTPLLGWITQTAPFPIITIGAAVETITQALTTSSGLSNNFGSFGFMTLPPLSLAQNIEAANWNKSQNVLYSFEVPVIPANAVAWGAIDGTGLGLIGGTSLTLTISPSTQTGTLSSGSETITLLSNTSSLTVGMPIAGTGIPLDTTITSIVSSTSITISNLATTSGAQTLTFYSNQYPEMFPMMIKAATNYNAVNSVQNYMFQMTAGLTPTVIDDTTADTMDGLRINYYGQTQSAGQYLAFYQRGVMMGIATDPVDQNVYANEQWLKQAASTAVMQLLLALPNVSANSQGNSQILATLQSVINLAVLNGTISVGKPLTNSQQLYIAQVTGDSKAVYQIQTLGYWINCVIVPLATNPVTYTAKWTLVYSKDDAIRKVEGTNDLI